MKKKVLTHLALFAVIFILAILYRSVSGGFINLSDAMIMILMTHSVAPYGAITAGLATSLADIVTGHGYYAPYTFIIKGIMAYLTALGYDKHWKNEVVCIILGILNVVGCSLCDYMLFGTVETLLRSLKIYGVQSLISVVIAIMANRYTKDIKDRYLK
ncbi:MAG: ECF transporter S component [Erysipelotrichaceae bacterium]|nr:ECF transporter S component [Erysipelotrichaceae bacterium]